MMEQTYFCEGPVCGTGPRCLCALGHLDVEAGSRARVVSGFRGFVLRCFRGWSSFSGPRGDFGRVIELAVLYPGWPSRSLASCSLLGTPVGGST